MKNISNDVGLKYDGGKPKMSLLPTGPLTEISKVLTFGATKYGRDNWKLVEPDRYADALMRHIFAFLDGERNDPETGLHHLAHAGCNVLFLLYSELKKIKNEEKKNVTE